MSLRKSYLLKTVQLTLVSMSQISAKKINYMSGTFYLFFAYLFSGMFSNLCVNQLILSSIL